MVYKKPEHHPKKYYLDLIQEYFPRVTFKKSRIVRHGWDNDVVILDDKLIFRFPKNPRYKKIFLSEVEFLKHFKKKTPVSIPNYIYLQKHPPFGGYKIVKGKQMHKHIFSTLSKQGKKRIAREVGKFLTAMHSVPVSVPKRAGFEEVKGGWHWDPTRTKLMYRGMKKLLFPKLTRKEVRWIEKQTNSYLSLNFNFKLKVVHGDLHGDHILTDVEKEKLTGVIDFADLSVGDPALDFAALWTYGEPFVRDSLTSYGHEVEPDFLDRSRFPYLMHRVLEMWDILKGSEIPTTFEGNRKVLRRIMNEGVDY